MAKRISTDKILQVYYLYKEGKGFEAVRRATKVPAPSYVYDKLMDVMRKNPTPTLRNRNYVEAVRVIRNEVPADIVSETNHISEFKLNELEQAFGAFTDKVQSFIEYQVNRQVEAVEKENKKLHKLVEDQERELLALKEAAKNSNWISNLQKKFA